MPLLRLLLRSTSEGFTITFNRDTEKYGLNITAQKEDKTATHHIHEGTLISSVDCDSEICLVIDRLKREIDTV